MGERVASVTSGPGPLRRALALAPDPGAAGRARRLVRDALDDAGRSGWTDAAELVVSELVTNAVLHARTDLEVAVVVHPDHARVEVRDSSPALPARRRYGEQATTGRGMALVASVSRDCGITALPDGKVVWCEVSSPDEEPSAEDLLAAWDEEQQDEDRWEVRRDEGPRDQGGGGPPSGPRPRPVPAPEPATGPLHRVRLLGIPPTLWAAARQHHDALLRELTLYLATHDGVAADLDAAEVARRSFSDPIIAAVEDALRRTPAPPVPRTELPTALAPIDLDLDLPPSVGPATAALQDALDTAERLATQEELLALPGQAEVVAVRDWVCEQVRSQLRGAAPRPWQGARHEQFETPARTPAGTGPAAPGRTGPAGGGGGPRPGPSSARDDVRDDVLGDVLGDVLDAAARTGRGVVVIDASSRITAVSERLAAALGWTPADLVGRRVVTIIPPALREAHIAGFSRHLSTGRSHVLGTPLVLPVLHADGTELTCRFLIERRPTATGRWLYLAWIDPVRETAAGPPLP